MRDFDECLYGRVQAETLRAREMWRRRDNLAKFEMLRDNLGECERLVDIGCGWGQFLEVAAKQVREVWGVDESIDRVADVSKVCPKARMVICRADKLDLPNAYFDVAVTAQMLHEVKLFGKEGEMEKVLREIRRVLAQGGRYLLFDHKDAGDGAVIIKLPREKMEQLTEFEDKYIYYRAEHEDIGDGVIRISRRCLQDFLTKDWALNSAMEEMEMNETHNVFAEQEITALVEQAGFRVDNWIPLTDIRDDLSEAGGEFLDGDRWYRKFLLIATKYH